MQYEIVLGVMGRDYINYMSLQTPQVHMCTLLFQAGCQRAMSGPIHGTVMACISRAGNWEAYKVARQAMRYCQYQVAHDILKSLNVKVR